MSTVGILRTVIVPYQAPDSPETGIMTGDAQFLSTLVPHELAQGVLTCYVNYYSYPGGVPTPGTAFRMDFIVDATADAAIVAALPTALPMAVTWSTPITYGA